MRSSPRPDLLSTAADEQQLLEQVLALWAADITLAKAQAESRIAASAELLAEQQTSEAAV
jgi:hypothetical protein